VLSFVVLVGEIAPPAFVQDGALDYLTPLSRSTRGRSVLTQQTTPSDELTERHERPAKTSVSITSRSRFCGVLDRDFDPCRPLPPLSFLGGFGGAPVSPPKDAFRVRSLPRSRHTLEQ
jgi:hypothetical protein